MDEASALCSCSCSLFHPGWTQSLDLHLRMQSCSNGPLFRRCLLYGKLKDLCCSFFAINQWIRDPICLEYKVNKSPSLNGVLFSMNQTWHSMTWLGATFSQNSARTFVKRQQSLQKYSLTFIASLSWVGAKDNTLCSDVISQLYSASSVEQLALFCYFSSNLAFSQMLVLSVEFIRARGRRNPDIFPFCCMDIAIYQSLQLLGKCYFLSW